MNGIAFAGLNRLNEVWMHGNICISEKFVGQTRIATMAQIVDTKCAFNETSSKTLSPISNCDQKFKVLENLMQKKLAEIEKLQNELSAAKTAKDHKPTGAKQRGGNQ